MWPCEVPSLNAYTCDDEPGRLVPSLSSNISVALFFPVFRRTLGSGSNLQTEIILYRF